MNTIIRQYNFRLETGTVGTDDENIANILYNINRMETKAFFKSTNPEALDEAFGELFVMIVAAKTFLVQFLKMAGDKTDAATADTVTTALDGAIQALRQARWEESDTAKKVAAFPEIYKNVLEIVPDVLALDAQSTGRV